ncbi:hypothetical protein RRSWK_02405 [Rhodopirellula sp. SWK7]|nr:hypothetical protein RRSWK_02405 [Rhodopirellula sp. SWK7]
MSLSIGNVRGEGGNGCGALRVEIPFGGAFRQRHGAAIEAVVTER